MPILRPLLGSRCTTICQILFLIHVIFSIDTVNASTSNGVKSVYEYTPITALDQYGQSTQLRHAQLASSQYGSLTIIAIATTSKSSSSQIRNDDDDHDDGKGEEEQVIVCCTLPNPTSPGLKRISKRSYQLIQPLSHDLSSNPPVITAMVGSGMKPDIQFLTKTLREYARRIWERYDVTPSVSRISQAMAQVCLSFMGYDLEDEIMDGVGPVIPIPSSDEERREPMGRPLGVHALILGIRDKKANMICVDPAGVQRFCNVWAMGKDGDAARKLLQDQWTKRMTVNEVKEMMIKVVKEIRFQDKVDEEKTDDNEDDTVMPLEILSDYGVRFSELRINHEANLSRN